MLGARKTLLIISMFLYFLLLFLYTKRTYHSLLSTCQTQIFACIRFLQHAFKSDYSNALKVQVLNYKITAHASSMFYTLFCLYA
jgi:hypothetical protein